MLSSNSSHSHFSSLIDENEIKNNKKLSIINETKEEEKKSENNNKKNISKKNNSIHSPSSSFSSLEFNSRIESKNKSYNFDNGLNNNNNNNNNEIPLTKYEEFLKFKKNLNNINKNFNNINNNNNNLYVNSRIQQRNNLYENINSKIKNIENKEIINDYSFEIKTLEEPTYDDFFKLKHKNIAPKKNLFQSTNNNNSKNNINLIENPKKKKEREKMKGYTCELCNKFYEAIGEENNQNICNECSRHKSLYNIVKTPESFYDLNL
jgi:hypothetical protein